MALKVRLVVMNFLQFFIWGAWLLTIGTYCFHTKHWSGNEFGAIFSTMGIASLFMPAIAGIIADRWPECGKALRNLPDHRRYSAFSGSDDGRSGFYVLANDDQYDLLYADDCFSDHDFLHFDEKQGNGHR